MSLSVLLALTALTAPAADAAAPPILTCEGPFARDASEATLKAAFGDANVVFQTVPGPEGTEAQATVVYPGDPSRMLTVYWWDETARAKPATIQVQADWPADPEGIDPWKTEIAWRSAQGVAIGSTLADVEALNGKPFNISGFGWDYGGFVTGWDGGKLETAEGECNLSVRFSASSDSIPEAAYGDGEFKSDTPAIREAAPKVTEFSIGYPAE